MIITREGELTPNESTAYYPDLSAKTKRYEKIKVMYEDREAKQQFLSAEGDLAALIQRKTDYLLGSDFRIRMTEEEKKLFDNKLEFGTDQLDFNDCPTVFKRDRILDNKIWTYCRYYGLLLGSFFQIKLRTYINTIGTLSYASSWLYSLDLFFLCTI